MWQTILWHLKWFLQFIGLFTGRTVPNPKSVAPKLQKLSHRKVSINVARTNEQQQRHQSGKTYSLVEMKFRRDKM